MVDVWEELGKSLGRALKPLGELASGIWRALGGATAGLVGDLLGSARSIKDTHRPGIEALLPDVLAEAAKGLGEGSPPKEIKDAVDKLIQELMAKVARDSKSEAKSVPELSDLVTRQAALTGGVISMYALTHAIAIALDASHIFKDWGFKSAIMDMMYQFDMKSVIGPMIQAPIWSGIVVPMRMRMNESYPYEVPASGTLPYLRLKGLITKEEYYLNMKFHAIDGAWADDLLENAVRYPDFADLRTMIHRGVKTWADARVSLEKSLVRSDYLDAYEKLIPGVPGSGDLVDMAVREAYQERSGDEEMPERFVTEMAKWGFDREACLWFWRKHWRLPDVGMVYDMDHRMIAKPQTIGQFLKWADYAPEWRKPLEDLSWRLPGRIDARWLFRWGEIGVEELRDLLEKEGLSKEWSGRVATAIAKNQYLVYINTEVSNTKADYVKGYSLESTLRSDLGALGFRPEIVAYHVADALADRERSIRDDQLSTLRAKYAKGSVTMADVVGAVATIIVDKVARDTWLAALVTAKQVMVVEETFTTEVNRLVENAKYDYVRGYTTKEAMVSRLQLLALPDEVVKFHVMDADEDRTRKRYDDRLIVIKDMWMKDVETDFAKIEEWVTEIIVEEEARGLWLDDAYFDKFRTVTRKVG